MTHMLFFTEERDCMKMIISNWKNCFQTNNLKQKKYQLLNSSFLPEYQVNVPYCWKPGAVASTYQTWLHLLHT